MATWTKVTAAAACAAAMFAAIVWWPHAANTAPPGSPDASASAPAVAVADDALMREPLRTAATSEPDPSPTAPLARAQVSYRGRVVDAATKEPLAAVVVAFAAGGKPPRADDPRCVTGGDGSFVFAAEARSCELWFTRDGYLQVRASRGGLVAGQQDDIGDIPLPRGRRLTGRIVDERGVALGAGTSLRARFAQSWGPGWQQYPTLDATVGVDGAFELAPAVAFGALTIELAGGEHELNATVDVSEHAPAELQLVATLRSRVRGVVVDEAGAPLQGIGLAIVPSEPVAVTAADGTFELLRPNHFEPPDVEVYVVDALPFAPLPPRRAPWGTHDLRIVLARTPPLQLEVVDDTGAPVEQFGVVLLRSGMTATPHGTVLQRSAHAGGRCSVAGAAPGATSLRVVPVDPLLTPSDMIAVDSAAPLRVVLARRVPCTVEVVCAGRPVGDAYVQMLFAGDAKLGEQHLQAPLDVRQGPRAWLPGGQPEIFAEGRTAVDGRVRLVRDRETAQRAVRVLRVDRPPFVVRDAVFPVDGGALRIELPGVGTVAGRVHLRGRRRTEVTIGLQQGDAWRRIGPQPDGTFRSPALLAGTWRVGIMGVDGLVVARDVDVVEGATTEVELDVNDVPPPASVRGRLVRDGTLPAGLVVELLRLTANSRPVAHGTARVAADGAFEVGELPAGTYRLALRAAGVPATQMPALLADTFVLAPGEQLRVDVPFPPRRLVVRLFRTDGAPVKAQKVLTRCDGVSWPSFGYFAAEVDAQVVFDPAPLLPVEFALFGGVPVWSTPVVMPPDRAVAEVDVVLPDAR